MAHLKVIGFYLVKTASNFQGFYDLSVDLESVMNAPRAEVSESQSLLFTR